MELAVIWTFSQTWEPFATKTRPHNLWTNQNSDSSFSPHMHKLSDSLLSQKQAVFVEKQLEFRSFLLNTYSWNTTIPKQVVFAEKQLEFQCFLLNTHAQTIRLTTIPKTSGICWKTTGIPILPTQHTFMKHYYPRTSGVCWKATGIPMFPTQHTCTNYQTHYYPQNKWYLLKNIWISDASYSTHMHKPLDLLLSPMYSLLVPPLLCWTRTYNKICKFSKQILTKTLLLPTHFKFLSSFSMFPSALFKTYKKHHHCFTKHKSQPQPKAKLFKWSKSFVSSFQPFGCSRSGLKTIHFTPFFLQKYCLILWNSWLYMITPASQQNVPQILTLLPSFNFTKEESIKFVFFFLFSHFFMHCHKNSSSLHHKIFFWHHPMTLLLRQPQQPFSNMSEPQKNMKCKLISPIQNQLVYQINSHKST